MLSAKRQGRPSRAEIDPAALELISRYGPQILAAARRYSLNPDDAEDAYQRGLEILLTKAPTTSEAELVPWLKTVVKHEAFAIRQQRERAAPVTQDEVLERAGNHGESLDEQAERYERLRIGAEALGRLKPQEVRCLLLRAEGYSYKQICELTGWTYTKVNRSITEGRAAFLKRLDGIQSGAECERLAPLLSVLADGEAGADDMAALRPHLRGCLACRATLREYRSAPRQVAALLPGPALLAGDGSGWLESLFGAVSDRAHALAMKAQGAAEIASAQKVAAVAASTAVLAGGGAATVKSLERGDPPPARAEQALRAEPAIPASSPAAPSRATVVAREAERRAAAERRRRALKSREERSAPAATEFDPTGNPTAPAAPAPPPPAGRGGGAQPLDPAGAEFGP